MHSQMSAACSGKPWNAIGSSTGSLILTHISQKHPHLIHRMLLISPAVHLADWFEKQGQLHAWSDDAPGAADAFMPNNTGDNSGSLRLTQNTKFSRLFFNLFAARLQAPHLLHPDMNFCEMHACMVWARWPRPTLRRSSFTQRWTNLCQLLIPANFATRTP